MNSIDRTDSKSKSEFLDYLVDDLMKADEDCEDIAQNFREARIKWHIDIRKINEPDSNSTPITGLLIMEQAADRYFDLLQMTRQSLDNKFTTKDIVTILNAECTPIWNYLPSHSIASMVLDDNGIESLDELDNDSSMKRLLEKLFELTPAQNATLADICERIWRCKSGKSISNLCSDMGLSLVD